MSRWNFAVQPFQRPSALVNPIALVVLSFLCAAPTWKQAHAQSVSRLQPLLNDTVVQLKLVYRHDTDELHRRYEHVSKVLAAWRAADRSEENNRRLEAWLRAAIRSSMPGSHEPLPPAPEFENLPAPAPPVEPVTEHSLMPAAPAPESPTAKPSSTATPRVIQPPAPTDAPPIQVEVSKPLLNKPITDSDAAAAHKVEEAAIEEKSDKSASDELSDISELPDVEDAPDLGELPDAESLPDIEDEALIEALSDPFVDDPQTVD